MAHIDRAYACSECDLLIELPEDTRPCDDLHCPRCGHLITHGERFDDHYLASLMITALMVFCVANQFEFLSFDSSGTDIHISIAATAFVLIDRAYYVLGTLVLAFIVVLPLVYLMSMLTLLALKSSTWAHIWQVRVGRFAALILPWAMADVFIVGVLVALIKLVALADIGFGLGFWSYIVFTMIFIHVSTIIDRQRVWRWVEAETSPV